MKRLGLIEENIEAYRASSTRGFNRIIKEQNTKKQTSAFTKPSKNIVDNIYVDTNFILKLKGTKIIGGDTDIWTLLDPSGRRWLSFSDAFTKSGTKALQEIQKLTVQAYIKDFPTVYEKVQYFAKHEKYNIESFAPRMILAMFFDDKNSTSPERNKMYKVFFDLVEKWLAKNIKLVKEHIQEIKIKNHAEYNEVVLTKFKILGYYTMEGKGDWDIKERKAQVKGIEKYKELGTLVIRDISDLEEL